MNKIKDLISRIEKYEKFLEVLCKYDSDDCQPLNLQNGFYDKGGNMVCITLYPEENEEFRQLFDKQYIRLKRQLKDMMKDE
jgi:hypothetical protein